MKILLICLAAILVKVTPTRAELPPLIDREQFFSYPEISYMKISPDGKFISFIKNYKDVRNIWIKGTDEPFSKARPLTTDTTRPVYPIYNWSRDSRYIIYQRDKGGDENFHVFSVQPEVPGKPMPPARDLTPIEKVQARIIDIPQKLHEEIIVGLNDRDPKVHDVYRIHLPTGKRTLVRKNDANIAGWLTDLEGTLRLGFRQTNDGGREIMQLKGDSLIPVFSVNAEEIAYPLRFTTDGNSFYLVTNKDTLDKMQLMQFDLKSRTLKRIEKDPKNEVDFNEALFSDSSNELIATVYIGDRQRLHFPKSTFQKDFQKMIQQLPDANIFLGNRTADERLWVLYTERDVDRGSYYLFDRKTGKVTFMRPAYPDFPTKHLPPMKAIRYKARDGLSIPAYIVLPKGIAPKKLPTVIYPHGGPWFRDTWRYHGVAQLLANRGYAVLLPNFRGSSGYGKKFLNAGNKQWGTGTMQHDITDGVQYLITQGIADPKRIGIAGGSYGGFATLAGLAFTPNLYAAGFDIVGPSNIITLLNSIPPYWEPEKKMWAKRVGDMEKPEERKMLEQQSPLNSARNIKAPLFVVQGANDPRVKKAESDQIVVALRDLGRNIQYICAPDEGHGFAGNDNRSAMYVAMEHFFAKYLGGRSQKEVPDHIKKKLDAITVNVKDVVVTTRATKDTTKSTSPSTADGASLDRDTLKSKKKSEL